MNRVGGFTGVILLIGINDQIRRGKLSVFQKLTGIMIIFKK
jgi:hypothetical protein